MGTGKYLVKNLAYLTDICPDIHLASEQIEQLLRAIDSDGDGSIDFTEFMEKLGSNKAQCLLIPMTWTLIGKNG